MEFALQEMGQILIRSLPLSTRRASLYKLLTRAQASLSELDVRTVGRLVEGAEVFAEREFIRRTVKNRPNQIGFRRDVLAAYEGTCVVTGERITEVLEAAHVIPVEYRGIDAVRNGLCLRSDIHKLFDSGHLRIQTSGELKKSAVVQRSPNYGSLPLTIRLPQFLSTEAIAWRWNYQ